MKKILILGLFILSMCHFSSYAELYPTKEVMNQLDSGDIILRSAATLDSLVLSRTGLGPYSHIGLVYKSVEGKISVLETFPSKGLQIHTLDYFLNPRHGKVIRLKFLKFNGADRFKIHRVLETMIQYSENINFDMAFEVDEEIPSLEELKVNQYNYYCVEMVNKSFEIAYGKDFLQLPNDYDGIINHIKKELGFYKENAAVYFKYKQLRMLQFKDAIFSLNRKIIYTPNGILKSKYFDVIFEGEDLSIVSDRLKIFL